MAQWDHVGVTEVYGIGSGSDQTSASVSRSCTAGNLIIGAVSIDKSSGAITPPTGWTEIFESVSASVSTWVGWRIATGDANDDFDISWTTASDNSDAHVGEWDSQSATPKLDPDTNTAFSETASTGQTVGLGSATTSGLLAAWVCVDSDKGTLDYTGVTEHANEIGSHQSGFGQSVGTFGSLKIAATDAREVISLWGGSDQNFLGVFQFIEEGGFTQSVFGSMPATSSIITKAIAVTRLGTMPTSTGTIVTKASFFRSLVGIMPTPTGIASTTVAIVQAISGIFGLISGSISKGISQGLTGNQPSATGGISKKTALNRQGDMPAPAGGAIQKNTAVSRQGEMPESTGDIQTSFSTAQGIVGIFGTIVGAVTAALNPVVAVTKRALKIIGSGFKKFIQ